MMCAFKYLVGRGYSNPSVKTEPLDQLPMDAWEEVMERLPARSQAALACAHPTFRDISRQPKWPMHRAHLDHALRQCKTTDEVIPVLEQHRHVLPHVDTLVLQPAAHETMLSGSSDDMARVAMASAMKSSELYPILDWLAAASERPFNILATSDVFGVVLLTNGRDKRHDCLTEPMKTYDMPLDTPEQFVAAMPVVQSDSRIIWASRIDDRCGCAYTVPNFWQTFVACYPAVGHIFMPRNIFDAVSAKLDLLCELKHFETLHVPNITARELPAGLKSRYEAGKLKLCDRP